MGAFESVDSITATLLGGARGTTMRRLHPIRGLLSVPGFTLSLRRCCGDTALRCFELIRRRRRVTLCCIQPFLRDADLLGSCLGAGVRALRRRRIRRRFTLQLLVALRHPLRGSGDTRGSL